GEPEAVSVRDPVRAPRPPSVPRPAVEEPADRLFVRHHRHLERVELVDGDGGLGLVPHLPADVDVPWDGARLPPCRDRRSPSRAGQSRQDDQGKRDTGGGPPDPHEDSSSALGDGPWYMAPPRSRQPILGPLMGNPWRSRRGRTPRLQPSTNASRAPSAIV